MKVKKRITFSRTTTIWIVGGLLLAIISLVKVWSLFRQGFDLGDGSTFYSFSHYLLQGEAIYRDFIHFRTPGSYFLWTLFLMLGDGSLLAMKFALNFETSFLYQMVLFLSLGVLFRWKRPGFAFLITLACIALPGYLQLRAALALLAIVFYIRAQQTDTENSRNRWLVAAGGLTGLAFTFGQEAAVVVIAAIGLYEVVQLVIRQQEAIVFMKRLLKLLLGFSIGILPLLIYVALFSDISNFLYYTLYYGFILQPQGMNLPFPAFGAESYIYYVPILLIATCSALFYVTKSNKTKREDQAFLIFCIFAILRLVTLYGRTDMGHFIYVLPELFVLVGWSLYRLLSARRYRLTLQGLLLFMAAAIGLLAATRLGSTFLIIVAGLVAVLYQYSRKQPVLYSDQNTAKYFALSLGAIIALGFSTLMLVYIDQVRQVKSGLTGQYQAGKTYYKGVFADPQEVATITQVEAAISRIQPKTLFSFPIQAYFYTSADHHATKFLTYEPQTTIAEQEDTIRDLEKNRPELVIFDPAQALDLSASVNKISDYVLSNYVVQQVITGKRIIWIMVPSTSHEPSGRKAVFSLLKFNSQSAANGIQSPEKGIINAVYQQASVVRFGLQPDDKRVTTSLYRENTDDTTCGELVFTDGKKELDKVAVCGSSALHVIIPQGSTQLELRSIKPLIWNDVTIQKHI